MTPPVALSTAGLDSSGGAGSQADRKTFAALRVLGAITALTAPNTTNVRNDVQVTPVANDVAQGFTAITSA